MFYTGIYHILRNELEKETFLMIVSIGINKTNDLNHPSFHGIDYAIVLTGLISYNKNLL